MIPRISFGQLTEDVEKSAYFVKNIANPAPVVDDFPAIPPKLSDVDATAPGDPDEKETWFIVQSPREQGTSGPFSIPQLRRMYKSGEIKNTTLFWAEGESDWQQLMYQRTLKPKLLQLPILPPRVGTYNAERAVYDPVIQAPPIEILDNAEELKGFDITKCCFKCGSMAIAHIPSVTTQIRLPDLFKGRVEIGTTDNTAEILPGLLWIGSAAAAKQRAIVRLGITLLFNCTTNMKGPTSQPPFFRCRDAPMRDQPKHSFTEEEKIELLNMFDRVYDLMEAHRLTPELAAKSDPIPKEYRGPTDKFGLPIKTAADLKVLRRPKDDEKPVFPPRILLWSRLGTDRPCALAAAYIIRQYGITVDHAVHIVRSNHIKTAISSPYMEVLHKWSERYTIGLLICIDCQARVDSTGSTIGDTAFDAEQRTRQATQRRTQRMKTHTEGEEDDSSSDDSDIGFEREGQENEPIPSTNANARLEIDSSLMENSLTESTVELKRIEFEKSLEDGFNTFVQLMKGHMHRMLKDRPHELTVLSRVETYLHKVLTNSVGIKERIPYFRWNGLMDLELSGRHLSDLTMAVLFQLLAGNNLIRQIRMLKLQSNLMASVSAKALLIAYFPEGHMADDTYFFDDSQSVADVDHGFDLMLLDLSNNKIDEFGVPYLQFFLKQCNTLTSLDVSNNKLGDFQCADIFQCFARPPLDFDDGDDTGSFGQYSVAERMKPHNYSITSLNMGLNEPGQNAVEALVNMIKHNAVLRTLVLDLSPGITPLQYKELSLAIRLYNGVLEEISLAENALSVKSVEYIARIFDSKEVAVNKLILTNCSLKYPHMTALMKYILSAQRLTYLDLSGNPIGDKGAAILIEMLSGKVNPLTSKAQPPLAKLDLSSCSMSSQGTAQVLEALAQRTTLTWLDLSHNIIGADNLTAYSALARCSIQDIRLNCCKVCSKGASLIFKSLSDKTTSFSKSVRYIYLSGNEISDSSTASLCLLLENNLTLEGMDLGFNLFTDRDAELLKQATSVHSNSQIEKKLLDFSVNLVGNKCDPYMLETPGMTRAKSTFLYGVQPNSADPVNQGYSHIPHCSRGHFMARKELDNHYREFIPLNPLNSIM